ncbi:ferrous iron transport protein B [Clostridium sp. YIM B02555]|uniref:ferrous iron transport protein B n=1 Tax=Clostridium sp. YIM B02555 TaxID=2911968 RepID=UPI001EEE1FD6|nr:ferrous iron transport protein B [Clostridium sp. YIM B02555]
MSIKIGLAGNPNCGKTTMFNELTGSSQYVGNWPGVTVEKKGGKLRGHKDVEIVDLPGVYSLSPYTLEEVVTRNFMLNDKPDAVINIIDASNIERNLYLTTQILELGIPTVIALNMMDIVQKNGHKIDINKLSKTLGCPVVETSALKGEGIKLAAEKAIEVANSNNKPKFALQYSKEANDAFKKIEEIITKNISIEGIEKRWLSVKLFERDENIIEKLKISKAILDEVEILITECETELDDDSESIVTGDRYAFIGEVVSAAVKKNSNIKETTSDRIDKIVTNRFLALPIFVAIMYVVYYIAITIGTIGTDWINDTLFGEIIQGNVSDWMTSAGVADWLQGLISSGIISGVGTVIGFVPQIALLFLFLSILEDCGYMSRVAFIMDRIFRKFGLSGKSFIPMLISSGCGVPGIMSTRTMENERDRKMTIMLTTFIPCSAKLPVIALIASAFFDDATWVAPSAYFLGIIMIVSCGIILKKTRLFSGDPSPFVMELPQYHIPGLKSVMIHMWDRVTAFMKKAATIILVSCSAVWFLQTFNWSFEMVDADNSILASIGNVVAPIFAPLGFGNWQSAVATVTGLVAKENLVGTFGVLYGIDGASETDPALISNIGVMFTAASGFAFMAFNLLCAPCFAAIGAIRREMGNWKWTFITLGFQTGTAYIVALVINQVGNYILGTGSLIGAVVSVIIAVGVVAIVILTGRNTKEKEVKGQLSYTR